MYCKNCGKEVDDDANFCLNCGAPIDHSEAQNTLGREEVRYCTNCGKQIHPNAYICVYCGARTQNEAPKNAVHTRSLIFGILSIVFSVITLYLIGAAFGMLGFTKAYEQKNKSGMMLNTIALIFCVLLCVIAIFL